MLAVLGTPTVNNLESVQSPRLASHPGIRRDASRLIQIMVLASMPLPAWSADGPWSASIDATTDYILRGVSQSYDRGALQLGGRYQDQHGWFVGAWSSNVDPYPRGASAVELDLYTGISRPLGGDFNASITYTHYQYLDDPRPAHYNYDEFAFSASYLDRLVATISYQPDLTQYSKLGFAERRASLGYELAGRWPLPMGLAIEGGAGYYDLQSLFGVSYWAGSTGVQYVYRRASVELTRFFADSTVGRLYDGASANGTWVLTAALRF
jgi:uncharacterized protein (TIGR02001 family)